MPAVPPGKEVEVIVSAVLTVMLRGWVAVCGVGTVESVAFTVKVVVPVAFGVPVMAPVLAVKEAQEGKEPLEMLQVTGGLPPALVRVVL